MPWTMHETQGPTTDAVDRGILSADTWTKGKRMRYFGRALRFVFENALTRHYPTDHGALLLVDRLGVPDCASFEYLLQTGVAAEPLDEAWEVNVDTLIEEDESSAQLGNWLCEAIAKAVDLAGTKCDPAYPQHQIRAGAVNFAATHSVISLVLEGHLPPRQGAELIQLAASAAMKSITLPEPDAEFFDLGKRMVPELFSDSAPDIVSEALYVTSKLIRVITGDGENTRYWLRNPIPGIYRLAALETCDGEWEIVDWELPYPENLENAAPGCFYPGRQRMVALAPSIAKYKKHFAASSDEEKAAALINTISFVRGVADGLLTGGFDVSDDELAAELLTLSAAEYTAFTAPYELLAQVRYPLPKEFNLVREKIAAED